MPGAMEQRKHNPRRSAVEASSISGFWAGLLVHFPGSTQVNLSLTASSGTITGTYEMPLVTTGHTTGGVTGTYGETIILRLTPDDPHDPNGVIQFAGSIQTAGARSMMEGTVTLPPSAQIPLASLTLFLVDVNGGPIEIFGAWSANEFGVVP
jgi:hypothetical protein